MKDQLRRRIFRKRIVRKITFIISSGLSIELNTYALLRPTVPGRDKLTFPFGVLVTVLHVTL